MGGRSNEDAKLGEDAVVMVGWAGEGRGRPNDRRLGVCVAIIILPVSSVAFDGN